MQKKEVGLGYYSSINTDKLLKEFKTSESGLSSQEAEKRILTYGKNILAKQKEVHIVIQFLMHFKSPLILVLIMATIVSFFFGETINAIIILVMILLGVTLEFFQEYSAGKAVQKLKEYVKTKADVLREGKEKEINIEDVCVGDIILLNPGCLIPADARIISSKELFVNQSSLTGESLPTEKFHTTVNSSKKSLFEINNLVFLGTSVVSGSGIAVAVNTGLNTEFGKLSKQLVKESSQTDFEKGITSFGYLIMKAIFFLVLSIFLINSLVKHNFLESFMFSLAVAVGLTPELLPVILSINMAKGSLNMAKKGAIVKKLSAIPSFGSMDILCTDKTGTLTEDKIKLVEYVDISGKNSEDVLLYTYLNSSYHTGIENPLDSAVKYFKRVNVQGYKKIDEIPFDFLRRKMSIVVEKNKNHFLITKGAPEEILRSCHHYELKDKSNKITPKIRSKIIDLFNDLSKQGYRVLAVSVKEIKRKKRSYNKTDESEMKFLGFAVFLDPPKSDVKEIIKETHEMGIKVKVLTGDNELITKKICDEVGLEVHGILLGKDIDSMSDSLFRLRVEDTTIFARCSPDQKNRIINALKYNGHVVGYLGDGINDALSLKTADIGISVNSAVDIAKESADIVLTHKSLEVLKNGVIEGRKSFSNTIKYITMGLSSNFGNMFSILAAVIFLPFLPMLPIQILLNNFIYDFSQITIPTDNVDKESVKRPKKWDMHFIKKFMFTFGPISSLFDMLTFYILYVVFKASESVFQTGWFIESLATQTFVIYIIRTKKIPFLQSRPSNLLIISTLFCVVLGWIIPYTPIGTFFGFSPLPINIIFTIVGLVLVYLLIVEFGKRIFYKKYDF